MTLLTEIALVIAAAAAIAGCLTRLPTSAPWPARTAARDRAVRPDQLTELERLVSGAAVSPMTLHARLRPLLAEIAAQRLAPLGYALDRMDDDAGVRVLGADLWGLVRPGRPFPEDRHGPGIGLERLELMFDRLERL